MSFIHTTRFESTLIELQNAINSKIPHFLYPLSTRPAKLHEAIDYSMEAGGKRIRPILLLTAFNLFPSQRDPYPAAIAVECLHTSSLIHDDLPSIDNSDLRRGHPTCHIQFNEATALLAGDSLIIHAFEMLSSHYASEPALACKLVNILAHASSSCELIGGQYEDIHNTIATRDVPTLEFIHAKKTASLITAVLHMGAIIGNMPEDSLKKLLAIGYHLGMAFQIIDDILDITSSKEILGKNTHKDQEGDTLTYPAVFGLEESQKIAHSHTQTALQLTQSIPADTEFLSDLIIFLENRIY